MYNMYLIRASVYIVQNLNIILCVFTIIFSWVIHAWIILNITDLVESILLMSSLFLSQFVWMYLIEIYTNYWKPRILIKYTISTLLSHHGIFHDIQENILFPYVVL